MKKPNGQKVVWLITDFGALIILPTLCTVLLAMGTFTVAAGWADF